MQNDKLGLQSLPVHKAPGGHLTEPGEGGFGHTRRTATLGRGQGQAFTKTYETGFKKLKMVEGNRETVAGELAFIFPGSFTHVALPPPAFPMS